MQFKSTSLKSNMDKLLFFALLSLVNSQIIIDTPCRDLNVINNFDVESYLGKWFEIEKYQQSFQIGGSCVTAEYTLNATAGEVIVLNSLTYLNENITQNVNFSLQGVAVLSFPEVVPLEAKLNVSFFNQPTDRSNYWVLDTDYINYSIVWSCEQFDNGTAQG